MQISAIASAKVKKPRAGQLVDLPRVPVLRQRRDSDVGDIVGVDERLGDVPGREDDLAVEDRLQEVVLAEVLHEPAAAHDRPLDAPCLLHGQLGALGLLLAPAGEEHQPPDPTLHGQLGERAHRLHRARDRDVREVGDVHRLHVSQRGRPRRLVLPVERRLAGAGADPHRQSARR